MISRKLEGNVLKVFFNSIHILNPVNYKQLDVKGYLLNHKYLFLRVYCTQWTVQVLNACASNSHFTLEIKLRGGDLHTLLM